MPIVLKNTFLDFDAQNAGAIGLRRTRSMPKFGQVPDLYGADAARQLVRLNTTYCASGKQSMEALADIATAPDARDPALPRDCNKPEVSDGRRSVTRSRPCKAKRDRLKRSMAILAGQIAEDPDIFVTGKFRLPLDYERDEKSRNRALASLAIVAAEAFAARHPTASRR
mmetsp:Transcript_133558/g.386616  ORF Transcript_133558/g.386616 Transcript_133558/m.386616 type:complete len:169 (-) Transcript_133558:133-639(-)